MSSQTATIFPRTASEGHELAGMHGEMLRFANMQLRDRSLAEDAVQEAFAAALANRRRFEGRAALRTWVFAILKNKIVDAMRDRWRKGKLDLDATGEYDGDLDKLFKPNGTWQPHERPADWGDPEQALESSRFWQVLEQCMAELPPATAQVFAMREFLELEVEEICMELQITPSNCWVILHRARMGLRRSLEKRGLGR